MINVDDKDLLCLTPFREGLIMCWIVLISCSKLQIDGLVQDCSNFIANALELLQTCTKPSKWLSVNLGNFRYNQPEKYCQYDDIYRFIEGTSASRIYLNAKHRS